MKVALPVAAGRLSPHFGHCEEFAVFRVEGGEVQEVERLPAPAHQPGALPEWLRGLGVEVVIACGMGRRARGFFEEYGIRVLTGAPPEEPDRVVADWLRGTLRTGENICDH